MDVPLFATYTLTGKVIEESPMCEPIAGTLIFNNRYKDTKTTISKGIDDKYWTVSLRVETSAVEIDEKYLVKTLETTFYCDLRDL